MKKDNNPIFIDRRTIDNSIKFPNNVNESKAPTDDSVRLFDEFLEKAKKYLVDSFKIENNVLDSSVFIFQQNVQMFSYQIYFKFKINNKVFDGNYDFDKRELYCSLDRNDIIKHLYNKMSNIIAEYIFKENFKTIVELKIY